MEAVKLEMKPAGQRLNTQKHRFVQLGDSVDECADLAAEIKRPSSGAWYRFRLCNKQLYDRINAPLEVKV